jgi:hypothetical protein
MRIDIDDPAIEARLMCISEWYGITNARYIEIVVNRAIDSLADELPGLSPLLELP